jgi:hypothetical protein
VVDDAVCADPIHIFKNGETVTLVRYEVET